ncbi:cytochrome P450 [Parafrankia colletiae]|uniref:cytochrome P450 n=1 Tax=Parafrankia colletiae TaxID=573497 RepID=UPI0009FD34F5
MQTVTDIDAVDFFRGDELIEDPYSYFHALRAKCPVQKEPHHNVVMVTGYDEAVSVFHDSEHFSSCISVTGPFPGFPVPLEGDDISELIERHRAELPMSDQLPTFDPPVHTDHRALLMRLITPKRLKENEEFIWRLADRLLDTYLADGEGEFISGFAGPFALLVIADLLGVPESDHEEFAARLQGRGHGDAGVGSTGDDHMAHSPLQFLYDKFSTYVEDRRREPRDDVLTGLATATFPDGSTPEVIDVVRVAANLFSAGQETTVRLVSTAAKVLAERPDLQALLRRESDRIPNFIEETLRLESPVKGDFRLSRVATTVGGVEIPAGTTVMVVNGAANRDPSRFANPDTFDAGRPNARQHIAFGRGIHSCPGAPLARAEARAGLERLLQRTSDIRISERVHGPADARNYRYLPTFILRGLTHLNLEFTPVENGS